MKNTLVVSFIAAFVSTAFAEPIDSRFGKLSLNENIVLTYKGKELVSGNTALLLDKKFQTIDSDVLLLNDTGGTVCPSTYVFVTISKAGIKVSDRFGSCNEHAGITQNADSIVVEVPGFLMVNGVTKPSAEKSKCVFTLKDGVVTRDPKSSPKLCSV